jgi:hypothetical protein
LPTLEAPQHDRRGELVDEGDLAKVVLGFMVFCEFVQSVGMAFADH